MFVRQQFGCVITTELMSALVFSRFDYCNRCSRSLDSCSYTLTASSVKRCNKTAFLMPNSKYVLLQVLLFAYYFDYFQVFYLNTKHAAIFPRTKIEQK